MWAQFCGSHVAAQHLAEAGDNTMTTAHTRVSLLMCAVLVLAACAQPEPTDQAAPVEPAVESFETPTGGKGWEPGVYLPEHCAEVFAGAATVFEDLISEADAVECVAPYAIW